MLRAYAAVTLLLIVGGCTAAPAPSTVSQSSGDPAPPPSTTPETGSITGSLLNDEALPVVGATVSIAGGNSSRSDDGGRFTFNDLRAGSYALVVGALGYEDAQKRVDVKPGEVSYANFTLVSIPISMARQRSWITDTMFEAAVTVPGATYYANQSGTTYRDIYIKVEPDVVSAVLGMTWATGPTSATWMELELWVATNACVDLCELLNVSSGVSPVVVRSDGFADWSEDQKYLQVNPTAKIVSCYRTGNPTRADDCVAQPATLVQVAYQQRTKIYTTAFFVEPAPTDYSPLPSA